ncbi:MULTISPECIES: hypothetical protein [Photorhabdus]|nr:hypothetical protein [Photorhabdus thracensis]
MNNVDRLYQTLPDLLKKWVFGDECATPIRKAVLDILPHFRTS